MNNKIRNVLPQCSAVACAVLLPMTLLANNFYVDANRGDDLWDGTTAAIPDQATIEAGGTIPGPRKTLHAMMSDSRVVAGDTVYAAEGDYNEGGEVYLSYETANRVKVKAGVTLRATGARDATFITGSGGPYPDGYTNGAVRCVNFIAPSTIEKNAGYNYGVVKGFTLRDGRTAPVDHNDESGGASKGEGLFVECDFVDNGSYGSAKGGTMHGGNALRCRFISAARGFLGFAQTSVIDSLVSVSSGFYSYCTAYNCTFTAGYVRGTGSAGGATYNCLFIGQGATNSDQKGTKHNNTFSRYNFHSTACTTNETCRVVTADETPYDGTTFRPALGSVAIDAGDISYYVAATNGWTAAWLAECGKDYYGGARVYNGKIDVGSGEYDCRQDFAAILGPDAVILAMGPNVTTNAVPNVVVPEGETITFSMMPLASDVKTLYEIVYTPHGGAQTVFSERSTDPLEHTLEGGCTIQSLTGSVCRGFVLIVR